MIYVLAYPVFDADTAERIASFRARHEPQRAKLVAPHITLVFGVGTVHLQTVSRLVDLVSQRTRAFPVTFDRHVSEFDPFETKHKVFLLCGEGGASATSLHDSLYDGPHRSELSTSHPFRPHMTIATYKEKSAADRVDVAALGVFPIEGQISALELVRVQDGQLTTLKTAPLIAGAG